MLLEFHEFVDDKTTVILLIITKYVIVRSVGAPPASLLPKRRHD